MCIHLHYDSTGLSMHLWFWTSLLLSFREEPVCLIITSYLIQLHNVICQCVGCLWIEIFSKIVIGNKQHSIQYVLSHETAWSMIPWLLYTVFFMNNCYLARPVGMKHEAFSKTDYSVFTHMSMEEAKSVLSNVTLVMVV